MHKGEEAGEDEGEVSEREGRGECEERSESVQSEVQTKNQSAVIEWTEEEDIKLFSMYKTEGSRWAVIAKSFKGKTKDNVRNRFYSTLRRIQRKKLKEAKVGGAANAKKGLLEYVDDAIKFGHYCFCKRGRPRKDTNKRGASETSQAQALEEGAAAAKSAGIPMFFPQPSPDSVDNPLAASSLETVRILINLINVQQVLIERLLIGGGREESRE